MYIKKYDLYSFEYKGRSFMSFRFEDNDTIPYYITNFLKEIYPQSVALWYENFIKISENFSKIGIFYGAEVTLDSKNNLIYISDADGDDYRIRTKNLTQDMVLEFCKNKSLESNVITKDNFIHLISSWIEILEQKPLFILLYQDDKDWYDVLPFESQIVMEQFVIDHAQKN